MGCIENSNTQNDKGDAGPAPAADKICERQDQDQTEADDCASCSCKVAMHSAARADVGSGLLQELGVAVVAEYAVSAFDGEAHGGWVVAAFEGIEGHLAVVVRQIEAVFTFSGNVLGGDVVDFIPEILNGNLMISEEAEEQYGRSLPGRSGPMADPHFDDPPKSSDRKLKSLLLEKGAIASKSLSDIVLPTTIPGPK